jgi:hypothetical protein
MRSKKWIWPVVVALGVVVAVGVVVYTSSRPPSPTFEKKKGESPSKLELEEGLVVPIGPNWKLSYRMEKGWANYYEYIPTEENLSNYTKMIRVVIGKGKKVNPARFIDRWAALWEKGCPGGKVYLIDDNLSSSTPWSEVKGVCPHGPEIFAKGIEGKGGFYFVSILFKKGGDRDREGLEFVKNVRLKYREVGK